jgi:hypothetical protein
VLGGENQLHLLKEDLCAYRSRHDSDVIQFDPFCFVRHLLQLLNCWMRYPLLVFWGGHREALGFPVGSSRTVAFVGHPKDLCLSSKLSCSLNGKLVRWVTCASPCYQTGQMFGGEAVSQWSASLFGRLCLAVSADSIRISRQGCYCLSKTSSESRLPTHNGTSS